FICLTRLDGSLSGDARANALASAMSYPCLLSALTLSNDRWISQLHWHRKDPKKAAATGESPGPLLQRGEFAAAACHGRLPRFGNWQGSIDSRSGLSLRISKLSA